MIRLLLFLILAGCTNLFVSCGYPQFNSNEFIRETGVHYQVGDMASSPDLRSLDGITYIKIPVYHYKRSPKLFSMGVSPSQMIHDESIPMKEYYVPLDQRQYVIWLSSPAKNPTLKKHKAHAMIPTHEFDIKRSRHIEQPQRKNKIAPTTGEPRNIDVFLSYQSTIPDLLLFSPCPHKTQLPAEFDFDWYYGVQFHKENSWWIQRRLADLDEIVIDTPVTIICATGYMIIRPFL